MHRRAKAFWKSLIHWGRPLRGRSRSDLLLAKVRRRTWFGMGVVGVAAFVLAVLLYFQQRAVIIESHLLRQDRILNELESGLHEAQERQIRLAWLMAHLVRTSPQGSPLRSRAWSLLASDSGVSHLSLVHPRWARLLWSRGQGQPWLARAFYSERKNLAVSDLEAPPPGRDSQWDAVMSVRVKGVLPKQDLELSTSGASLRQIVEPFLQNRGLSLGIVNQKGIWFPLYSRDSSGPKAYEAVPLSGEVIQQLRTEPRGLLWRGVGDENDPLQPGSLVHVQKIKTWGGLEWLLVLHLPRREITAPLISQFGWSALILALFALLWGSLAWYLVRRDLHLSKLREDNEQLRELRRKDEQLLQAEKLATVGVLVSGLAHEIGTPLGIVAMRLQLMRRKTEDDSDERRTLDVSLEQLDRVTGLIRQLLDFARSKPGLAQPVELPRMAQAIGNLVLPMAKRKRAELDFQIPDDLPRISGMPDGIQQILLNLVMNALQAIGDEGVVLVRAQLLSNAVELTVDDNGPGIPEEQRAAIFDPFFTTKPQGEGSGLGLTVVLGLVRRMQAEMLVEESTLGGARFVIRFTLWGA